jgi:hypothetical protein
MNAYEGSPLFRNFLKTFAVIKTHFVSEQIIVRLVFWPWKDWPFSWKKKKKQQQKNNKTNKHLSLTSLAENKCAEMIMYPDLHDIDTIARGGIKKTRALLQKQIDTKGMYF